MPKIFTFFLALFLLSSFPISFPFYYKDVPPDHWALEVIDNLTFLGVVNGYPDNTFRPEAPLTRAEFAKIFALSFHLPLPQETSSPFRDLETSHWANPYIWACFQEGVIQGYPGGYFFPEKPIALEEALAILMRHVSARLNLIPETEVFGSVSPDRWSYPFIKTALALGIIPKEDPHFLHNGEFMPDSPCFRAQVCFLVFRTKFFGDSLSLETPREYRATYTIHLRNIGEGKSGTIDFTLSTIPEVLPFQRVKEISFFPEPKRFETDDQGNRFAIFSLGGVEAGEEISVVMEAEVEVFPFTYLPDPQINSLKYKTGTPEYIRFTSPEFFEESDRPEIKEKAQQLKKEGLFETSFEVYDFVRTYLEYSGYSSRSSGALQALLSGKGDCTEFADLFVALERASGIPSRFVEGFVYSEGSRRREDQTHDWAEIILPGGIWLSVDPTYGRFGENFFFSSEGEHIILTRGRNLEPLGGFHYYYYHYGTGGGKAEINSFEEIEIILKRTANLTVGWEQFKLSWSEANIKKVINL